MIHAVSLDVDDTLIDHTASASAALYEVGGTPGSWPLWQRITDEHVARVVAGELPYSSMHTVRTKAYFAELGEYIDDAQAEWIDTERQRALPKHLRLFDDTIDCLDWLAAMGVRLAAVTNASGAHQRVKLADLGIARYFETVVVAGEVGCAKPDPVIFHTACARLGVLPNETVHVGDRLTCDARGAHEAGMHGVWLDRACGPNSEPDVHTVHTLAELPELLIGDFELAPTAVSAGPAPRLTPEFTALKAVL